MITTWGCFREYSISRNGISIRFGSRKRCSVRRGWEDICRRGCSRIVICCGIIERRFLLGLIIRIKGYCLRSILLRRSWRRLGRKLELFLGSLLILLFFRILLWGIVLRNCRELLIGPFKRQSKGSLMKLHGNSVTQDRRPIHMWWVNSHKSTQKK